MKHKISLQVTLTNKVTADVEIPLHEFESFERLKVLCMLPNLSERESKEVQMLEDWYLKWERKLCEDSLLASQGINNSNEEGISKGITIHHNYCNLNVDSFVATQENPVNKIRLNA